MAGVQGRSKWQLLLLIKALLFLKVSCCHPSSRELHICLNVYLERDFPLIETIVEGQQQQDRQGRGMVILEGPDLANICTHISSLRICYSQLLPECDSAWQLDRFSRLMGVLNATHHHLCGNGTDNVRDLLLNSGCMARARAHISNCTGFNWWISWREVLRMQVSPNDRCVALKSYRDCLKHHLPAVSCGVEASRAYIGLIDVWLQSWCALGSSEEGNRRYLYDAVNANKYLEENSDESRN